MPTVDVDFDELRRLTGHDKSDEAFRSDLFELGLEYEGRTEEGLAQLEFGPDRLDRLSVEGIARSLRYQYGDDRGVYVPRTNSPEWTYVVEESVPAERPYVTGAIVRGVDFDEAALDSLIQLQEKLHATMGRARVKGAIGIHDLAMVKGNRVLGAAEEASEERDEPRNCDSVAEDGHSITYRGIEPDAEAFVPLDADVEFTPEEVLTEHPTGREYAGVVAEYERMPAIYDDIGLFSFPPVINGRRTELDTGSRDLLVEMTGTDQWTIDRMCAIVCYALDARGAAIEDVEVEYPDRTLFRPDFDTREKEVSHGHIERVLGIELDRETVVDLAERSGLDAEIAEAESAGTHQDQDSRDAVDVDVDHTYQVSIPPYRIDVLHPLDVIDDVGRAYGFNELKPRYPAIGTVGGRHERSRLERAVRRTLVGLGFEDLLNFHLISEREVFDRMGLERPADDAHEAADRPYGAATPARIQEPYSEEYEFVRTWALPSLMMVLENNTHREYPQDLAEIGLAARLAEGEGGKNTELSEFRTIGAVLARTDASYEDAKARLAALARAFDAELETPATDHSSFIDGRVANVSLDGRPVGVIGEIHPAVLVEHDLEVPVAAFEFRLDGLR